MFGFASGVWMALRTFMPRLAFKVKNGGDWPHTKTLRSRAVLEEMPFSAQCMYAERVLRMMGLVNDFAPLVVICGHGSTTQNNAYATALDCGACGGRHGASNARVLAAMLNRAEVRLHLAEKNILIPQETIFIAAEHNTTTDEVTIFGSTVNDRIEKLKLDLQTARITNNHFRLKQMGKKKQTFPG